MIDDTHPLLIIHNSTSLFFLSHLSSLYLTDFPTQVSRSVSLIFSMSSSSSSSSSSCCDCEGVSDEIGEANYDHFDRLPDSVVVIVFNKIGDVKALGRCCVVSRRFHSLVPQVDNVVVRVDCVISEDESSSSSPPTSSDSSRTLSSFLRLVLGGFVKPLQALAQFLSPKKTSDLGHHVDDLENEASSSGGGGGGGGGVTHHSPTQVLKNFKDIRTLRIDLPSGELGIGDAVLLKWRADFGSTLDNCFILGASSSSTNHSPSHSSPPSQSTTLTLDDNANATIPESFYTNGGLKLRVVWTISSLIAASARHYLLHPIIAQHHTLDTLLLTDADGQGILSMNKHQLQQLRLNPSSPSTASKRTLVPALNMRLWYAPHLQLPNGLVLNGATLVAIRPSSSLNKDLTDPSSFHFDEPYATAAKLLAKRRTYCLEMNSF